jgi:hypothetical protein
MRVSDSRRLLFVHVQKTGGASMHHILGKHIPDLRGVAGTSDRHAPLRKILRLEPELTDYWIFGFVRNPWARLVSWWAMLERVSERAAQGQPTAVRMMSNIKFIAGASQYPDFETFIHRGPEEWTRLRVPQIDYLQTKTRKADFIGRTERYEEDTREILTRFDLPFPEELTRTNTSKHGHYRDYYTPATRDRVGEIFAADIEAFDYTF